MLPYSLGFVPRNPTRPSLLKSCKARIAQLEAQLAMERLLVSHLGAVEESDLGDVHSSLQGLSLFDRLPTEIWSKIFLEVVKTDSMAIGPILLVCQYWHDIACGTPVLWTQIDSKLRVDPSQINRLTSYIRKATKCNNSLPLTITIGLPSIRDLWMEIATKVYTDPSWQRKQNETTGFRSMDIPELIGWFEDVAGTRNEFDSPKSLYQSCPPFRDISDAINNHIEALLGVNGENLERINHLTICFNSETSSRWYDGGKGSFFHRLKATPEYLSIVDKAYMDTWPQNQIYMHPNPNLKYLSWWSTCSPDPVLVESRQLLDLRIILHGSSSRPAYTFPALQYTRNLRRLYLYLRPGWFGSLVAPQGLLIFSRLEDLALSHVFDTAYIQAIRAPRLKSLRLLFENPVGEPGLKYISQFSSIEKLHAYNGPSFQGFPINNILQIYPRIKEIGIVGPYTMKVRNIVQTMVIEGVAVKGYLYSDEYFWRLDTSYEEHEISV